MVKRRVKGHVHEQFEFYLPAPPVLIEEKPKHDKTWDPNLEADLKRIENSNEAAVADRIGWARRR